MEQVYQEECEAWWWEGYSVGNDHSARCWMNHTDRRKPQQGVILWDIEEWPLGYLQRPSPLFLWLLLPAGQWSKELGEGCFHKNKVHLLPWPPSSPDINIIENLWDHLDHWVWAQNPLSHSESDLWIALKEEWYQIEPSFIENLYASLPQQVSEVYHANEGNIIY